MCYGLSLPTVHIKRYMNFSVKAFFYQIFIDPILSRLHKSISEYIKSSDRVIDIACGTGSLSMALSGKAMHVTGIDLSEEMIAAAMRSVRKTGIKNVIFQTRDASDMADYKDQEFDVAITSMAVHQFDAQLAAEILMEMKRIARKVIIVDYNHPMPRGFSRAVAYGIEMIAKGDHYRNFRVYMDKGGINYFINQAGLFLESRIIKGDGVFVIGVCS
jgi:SAM-dependent methyltransferase